MNPVELSHKLRKDAISKGHSVQTVVSGYSMYPFLRKGDLLTVEPVPMETIKRGDIVVFEVEEKWIAHRVLRIDYSESELKLITKGDARLTLDCSVGQNYVGRVSRLLRKNREISLISWVYKLYSKIILKFGYKLCFLLNHIARRKFRGNRSEVT